MLALQRCADHRTDSADRNRDVEPRAILGPDEQRRGHHADERDSLFIPSSRRMAVHNAGRRPFWRVQVYQR